ncbi:MAG: hypothetical protein HC767_03260 [Akkermansiaceae bacterium]|nr:hypothetical protein [Akkermansiaceae bacterium]
MQLEAKLQRYRSEVDNLELALASAECKEEIKCEEGPEIREENVELIAAGVAQHEVPQVLTVHMHDSDQEVLEASDPAVVSAVQQQEQQRGEVAELSSLPVAEMGEKEVRRQLELLRAEVGVLRAQLEETRSERLQLQHAVSVAVADTGEMLGALQDEQYAEVRVACCAEDVLALSLCLSLAHPFSCELFAMCYAAIAVQSMLGFGQSPVSAGGVFGSLRPASR